MSLLITSTTDHKSYFTSANGLPSGLWLDGESSGSNGAVGFYWDRFDRIVSKCDAASGIGWLAWDPNVLDETTAKLNYYDPGAASDFPRMMVGYHDRVNNTQSLYGHSNSGVGAITEADQTDFSDTGTWAFDSFVRYFDGRPIAAEGGRENGDGQMVIFEDWGYAIQTLADVRFGGVVYQNMMCKIDLNTADSTPITAMGSGLGPEDGFIAKHEASPNDFTGSLFAGDAFELNKLQFVPDEDSTPAAPKGFFHMQSESDGSLISGNQHRVYIKHIEFNPTVKAAAPGTPNREDGRVVLFTRLILLEDTAPTTLGGIGTSPGGPVPYLNEHLIYHPLTRTLRGAFGEEIGGSDPNFVVVLVAPTVPAVAEITPPTPFVEVTTAKTATFGATVRGDLNERIAGETVTWDLKRASTVGEILTNPGPAGTTTVANVPIDDDGLEVYEDGVLLTETTHYTVNRALGQITGVGAKFVASATLTCNYRHRTNTVAPAHGSLRTSQSDSDLTGQALARVEYPDNDELADEIDELTGTTS
jgi:hypothetical protein